MTVSAPSRGGGQGLADALAGEGVERALRVLGCS